MKAVAVLGLGLALSVAGSGAAQASCEDAAKAPRADSGHPSAALVDGVWARVHGAFGALTGRATELVVLDSQAKKADGAAFPASAFLCPAKPGQVPRVYVTWPLIMRAQADALYDVDFLALVLGHELGHRARDLTFEGQIDPTATERGPGIEARADVHGAFFAAIGGYSTRRLACDAALDTFLDVEAHVGEPVRAERRKKLAEALMAFDVYESLYDASTGLTFADTKRAKKLLSWVDKHLGRRLEPIPEFKVLLALVELTEAAPQAPLWTWFDGKAAPPVDHLRCAPVFPQHTAFWDDLLQEAKAMEGVVPVRGGGDQIRKAQGLLREALKLGASPLAVHSALACSSAYLGEADKAKLSLDAARAHAAGRPKAVLAALDADEAFIAWAAWVTAQDNAAPTREAPEAERKAWAKKAQGLASKLAPHRQLSAWVKAVASYPKPLEAAKAAFQCALEPPKALPGEGLTRMPSLPLAPMTAVGGCPCGWLELHFLDDDLTRSDPNDGVRTCVPAGWATGRRWVDVRAPGAGLDLRMLLMDDLEGPLANLRTWEKGCASLEAKGTSDRGQTAYLGACPELGAAQVVLMADDCRVRRAVLVSP